MLERLDHTGGAAVSTRPFPGVDARLSRYSYLVSLLPRKIVRDLGLDFRLRTRTISSYTPAERAGRPTGLLVGGGERRTREAFARLTGGDREYAAWQRFHGMTGRVAERVFPTLTEPLPTRDELRRRVDDEEAWRLLFEQPIGVAVEEHFADDLVRGVVLTDALIGTFADAHDEDLRQNRCFLYHVIGGGTGAWDVPVGGMGALTGALAAAAREAGAVLATGHEALRIDTDGRTAEVAYRTHDGEGVAAARHVLVGASPPELAALTGDPPPVPAEGAQLKVNMLLTRLPRPRDPAVDPREAFAGTFHVAEGYRHLATAYAQAAAGDLPAAPPSEIYCHSLTDPSILAPRPGRARLPDAHPVRPAHPGPALRAGQRRRPRRPAESGPRPARHPPRRTPRRLPGHRRRGTALHRGEDAAGPGTRPAAARRQHLPPRAVLALRPGGHRPLGRRDPARQRAAVRGGRRARRRGERGAGAQRGDGGASGRRPTPVTRLRRGPVSRPRPSGPPPRSAPRRPAAPRPTGRCRPPRRAGRRGTPRGRRTAGRWCTAGAR
ncbi:hypothetical protein GCM10020295_07050 [Streptomyces cinereospinus]